MQGLKEAAVDDMTLVGDAKGIPGSHFQNHIYCLQNNMLLAAAADGEYGLSLLPSKSHLRASL